MPDTPAGAGRKHAVIVPEPQNLAWAAGYWHTNTVSPCSTRCDNDFFPDIFVQISAGNDGMPRMHDRCVTPLALPAAAAIPAAWQSRSAPAPITATSLLPHRRRCLAAALRPWQTQPKLAANQFSHQGAESFHGSGCRLGCHCPGLRINTVLAWNRKHFSAARNWQERPALHRY